MIVRKNVLAFLLAAIVLLLFFQISFEIGIFSNDSKISMRDVLFLQSKVATLSDDTKRLQSAIQALAHVSDAKEFDEALQRPWQPVGCADAPYVDFMFNVTSFLPSTDLTSRTHHDALAIDLWDELERLQLPHNCRIAEHKQIISVLPGYGFSAVLLYQPRIFSYSVSRQMTYIPTGKVAGAAAANSTICPAADLSCVYQRMSTCTPETAAPDVIHSHPLAESFKAEDKLFAMPEKYKHKGWFWWAAQTLRFSTRPNDRLKEMVADAKKKLRWEQPMIGMHIRRSDSCRTRATCRPLDDYFNAARNISRLYGGIRNVYVATDGSEVIEELKKGKYDSEFDIRFLEWDRSGFDWMANLDKNINMWLEPCHEKGICDGIMDMFTMALDYELLSDADYFVGQFTSGASRLPYALSFAKKNCFVPFVTLDIPWCNHWGTPPMTWGGYPNIMC